MNHPFRPLRNAQLFLFGVFFCYLLLLMKMLFFSRLSLAALLQGEKLPARGINLVPFYSIGQYLFSGSAGMRSSAVVNVLGNVMVFVPLGAYLAYFRRTRGVWLHLGTVAAVSLTAEVLQWSLSIGSADVDDLILNVLGGLIGILICRLPVLLRREQWLEPAALTLSALGLPVLLYLLFFIKMRF